ncbi:LysR family transcriptional regulator [Aquimarina sp. W85]|uniref:LysR family transcriptional regulator n=1 Tax=Aquimarina rhodophyticola TaxID=3342246 RepID=UPI00366CE72E
MRHQLELRHFNYFIAVAEELHFRRAAERLHISQPGLSRQIKQMETIIGAKLFVRDKRNVVLTTAGAYLKKELSHILNHVEVTLKHTELIDKGDLGEIRIGFLGSAMQQVIPKLLVQTNKTHPDIKFSLEEMSNYDQVESILNDTLDLGFVRLDFVPDPIAKKEILTETFSIVLPQNHPLNKDRFENIAQLKDENFILFSSDYSSLYFAQIMSICQDAGFSPKVSHKSVHAQTIFKLVENGLGVAIVPTSLQDGFDLDIKCFEIPKIPQRAVLSIIWRKDNRNPVLPHIKSFL